MRDRARALLVTLCFIRSREGILLLRAAPSKDRFAGLWNGIGGHVRPGESILEAARREIREEAGFEARSLHLRGVIHESGLRGRAHLLFVFTAEVDVEQARRARASTVEGTLAWFPLDGIPWDHVVPDLRAMLPRLLAGEDLLFGVQEFDGADRSLRLRLES